MSESIVHLISLSAKIILLGGIAWAQLYLLRRAPASSRNRLCAVVLAAIVLLSAGEVLVPLWKAKAPVYEFTVHSVAAPSPASSIAPQPWLLYAWIAGAVLLLSRAVVGRAAIAWLRGRSIVVERVSGVEVRIAEVQTPILAGLVRPAVLLPETARAWTDEQRRMVLAHEFAHLRQGDCWTNLLAQVLRAVFWFHPVIWLLVARLSREQELACDEAVVASGHSPHDYAAFLLDAVRRLNSCEIFACAMAGSGARSMKQRFACLLESGPRPPLTRRIAVCLVLFVGAVGALILIRPVLSHRPVLAQSPMSPQGSTIWQRAATAQANPSAQGRAVAQSDAPAPEEQVYKVGGDVISPRVLSRIDPQYTAEARQAKIAGRVIARMIITAEGNPENIEITQGIGYGLDERAIDAISQWTFQPATRNGRAVAVWATVEVNFRLL